MWAEESPLDAPIVATPYGLHPENELCRIVRRTQRFDLGADEWSLFMALRRDRDIEIHDVSHYLEGLRP